MAIVLEGTATRAEVASALTLAVAVPAGAVSGEVLVAAVVASRTSTGNDVTGPAGWNLIASRADSTATGVVVTLWYRIATSAEPATYTWTADVAGRITAFVQRLSGVDLGTPLDAAAVSRADPATGSTITGTVVQPSITTVTAGALILAVAAVNAASAATLTVPSGVTQIITSTGTGRRAYLAQIARPTAGATPTYSWVSSDATLQTAVAAAAFRPAGGAAAAALIDRVHGVNSTVRTTTTGAVSVRLKIGTNAAVTTGVVYTAPQSPTALGKTTHTFASLAGVTSGMYYRVEMTNSAGAVTLDSATAVGRIRIAPTGQTSFAFCFGSCVNGTDSAALAAVAARGDDLFLHLGDLYYDDGSGSGVANFRNKFNPKLAAPNHAAVFATTATAYIPSDHDGMSNNSTAGTDFTAWTSWNQVYRESFPTPALPTDMGCYYTFRWGRVRFIVTDTRSFKDDPALTDNSAKSALGPTQKTWLKNQITNSTESAIVIVNADPWIGAASAGDDAWLGFTTERAELAAFYAASGKNIVMTGGDMHALGADSGTNSPGGVAVFQAAPLLNGASVKGGPYSAGTYPAAGVTTTVQQYGRMVVTDSGTSIAFTFTGYSSDNTSRITLTKTFTVAAPPATPTINLRYKTPTSAETLTKLRYLSGSGVVDLSSLVLNGASSNPSGVEAPSGNLPGWTLAKVEDFDTDAPLGQFANVYGAAFAGYVGGTDTSKNGTYRADKTLAVANGICKVTLWREAGQTLAYSVAIQPTGLVGRRYGRWSVRYRTQRNIVDRSHMAFLLWPTSGVWEQGEVDFPEHQLGSRINAYFHQTNSQLPSDPNVNQYALATGVSSLDWHTATLEWTPGLLRVLIDEVEVGRSTDPRAIPVVNMRWSLQLETHLITSFITPVGTYESPVGTCEIDWVAVWDYTP